MHYLNVFRLNTRFFAMLDNGTCRLEQLCDPFLQIIMNICETLLLKANNIAMLLHNLGFAFFINDGFGKQQAAAISGRGKESRREVDRRPSGANPQGIRSEQQHHAGNSQNYA